MIHSVAGLCFVMVVVHSLLYCCHYLPYMLLKIEAMSILPKQ